MKRLRFSSFARCASRASCIVATLLASASAHAQTAGGSPEPTVTPPHASTPETGDTHDHAGATPVTLSAPHVKPFPDEARIDKTTDAGKTSDGKNAGPEFKAQSGAVWTQKDRRPLPDYDGRGSHTDAGDVLLWIPRVIVSPLYLVSEFAIRRPLGALITAAENSNIPAELYDFFAFGPDHKAGIAPTIFFDFGFRPSVGVLAFWEDAFAKGNNLNASFSTWGDDWLAGSLTDRVHLSDRKEDWFTMHVMGVTRPDKTFFGLGPRSLQANLSRYGMSMVEGGGAIDWRLWHSSSVHVATGAQYVAFKRGGYGDDPTLDDQIHDKLFATPPGYPNGYTEVYSRLALAFDTRRGIGHSGTGFRVEGDGEVDTSLSASPSAGGTWAKYGGSAGVFYDLDRRQRVVSLSVTAQFVDPANNAQIPFTELVTLGGYGPMKGFLPGRLADRSAAVAELAYTWPIWMYLNGISRLEMGNVFGTHLQSFDPSLFRLSGALGIQAVGTPDSSIEFLIGAGSETFEHGTQIDSFRLYVGTSRGF